MVRQACVMGNNSTMKPLVLLIPGLDGTGRLFGRQLAALEARFRIRAWEFRRGAGLVELADFVKDLAEGTCAEAPGSVTVVGESFGGAVGISYVLAHPDRVRQLALINAFPLYRRRVRINLACRLAPLLRWPGIRGLKDLVADRILAGEGVAKQERQLYHEAIRGIDMEGYRQRLDIVRRVDLAGRLRDITVPTLLFASGRDKLVPSVAEARFMAARIPYSRLYEFPRAGHGLLLTPGFQLSDYL